MVILATFSTSNLSASVTHSKTVMEEIVSVGETLIFQLSGTCFEIYVRNLLQRQVLGSFSTASRDISGRVADL